MVLQDKLFLNKLNSGKESEAVNLLKNSSNEELFKVLTLKQKRTGKPVIHEVIQWSPKNLLKILNRFGNSEQRDLLRQRDINANTPLHLIRHRWDSVKEIIAVLHPTTSAELLRLTNRYGDAVKPRHVEVTLPNTGRCTLGNVKLNHQPAEISTENHQATRSQQHNTIQKDKRQLISGNREKKSFLTLVAEPEQPATNNLLISGARKSVEISLKTLAERTTDGNTLLHLICENQAWTPYFEQALQLGQDLIPLLKMHNNHGETPLHLSAINNCTKTLEQCFKYEWTVSLLRTVMNKRKETLLHTAIKQDKLDVAKKLFLTIVGEPQDLFDRHDENGCSYLTFTLKYHRSKILSEIMSMLKTSSPLDKPLMEEYLKSEAFHALSDLSSEEIQALNRYSDTYILPCKNNKRCKMVAIIAVNHFRGKENQRDGSEEEAVEIVDGWVSVGFHVERIDDWTEETLNKFVKDKITENEGEICCWVLCLLSHGEFGKIEGADGIYHSVSQIIAQTEKMLEGNFPKLTVIQACQIRSGWSRNVQNSIGHSYDADPDYQLTPNPLDEELRTKDHSGILISTGYQNYALRNLFIPLLAQQLKACDGKLTLDEIHHRVAREIHSQGECAPVFKHQLLGDIRFNAQ